MILNAESSFELMRQKLENKLTNFTYVFDSFDRDHKGQINDMNLRTIFGEI